MNKENSLFITALHGDEGFLIPVLQEIVELYPPKRYCYDWMIGNPRAYKANQRFVETDLNRCAPGDPESDLYEERRAAEIVRMSCSKRFMVDIHATPSNCGVCTIVTSPNLKNLLLAASLGCENNVIWNNPESVNRGPVTQHVVCPAVELECGPKESPETQEELFRILDRFIRGNQQVDLSTISSGSWYVVTKGASCGTDSRDFVPFQQNGSEIVPFLSNTYKPGRCVALERIEFDKLFYSSI